MKSDLGYKNVEIPTNLYRKFASQKLLTNCKYEDLKCIENVDPLEYRKRFLVIALS